MINSSGLKWNDTMGKAIDPASGDLWVNIGPGVHMSEQTLGDWQQKINEWCQENLSEDFFCDWEFGAGQGVDADCLLFVSFNNEEDKVKFILRWG